MKTHITIAFYGEHKPEHFEGETLADARRAFLSSCTDSDILGRFAALWADYRKQLRNGISVSSCSHDCCRYSVRLADYPRDTWLDSACAELPLHPGFTR